MKIGFDLDGVLCEIDVAVLRIIDGIKDNRLQISANEWYYRERKPQLNANLFLSENDKMIIITSRNELLNEITKKWVKRYYPNAKLIILNHKLPLNLITSKEIDKWLKEQARVKAKVLDNLCEIYFEDTPAVIEELRKNCKKCKIIHYGGRW